MIVRELRDNADGRGPQIVEIEVPDLTPEDIAAKAARRERIMAERKAKNATP